MTSAKRLAVLTSFSGDGGVERMMLNLLHGFAAEGLAVDLLTIRGAPAALGQLPDAVRVLDLKVNHSRAATAPLLRYLQDERPAALLTAKDRAIRAAVAAKTQLNWPLHLVGRLGTHLSAALADRSALQRWWRLRPMRRIYSSVDHIIAVAEGVASDIVNIAGIPPARVSVIRNPVITPTLQRAANEPLHHPWFEPGGAPVIVGAGRLTAQKDFATLIQAFSIVHRQRPAKLLILGEGRQRPALTALSAKLGVTAAVDLPGFVANPYPFMARAAVFALSSAWEGSPNVLTEALALGTPAVATDCPSGPAETLRGGKIGPLVAVGDAPGLAAALLATLADPPASDDLREAVAEYTVTASARHYLRVLGLAS